MSATLRLSRIRPVLLCGALFAAFVPAIAQGQQSDDEWLGNCQEQSRRDRYVHCDVIVERMRASSGTLRIDGGTNGGVMVVGEDRNDIEVHARIQTRAQSRSAAESLAEGIELSLSGGEISSDGPDTEEDESWSVMLVVFMPRRANLEIQAHNGPVSVANVSGSIEANTLNGPMSLRDVSGNVVARTQNGPLSVTLAGSRWTGDGLDAETGNGPVTLTLPENYSAELETGTVHGPFSTDVPLTVTRFGRNERRIRTTLGNGGPKVRVVTTNGPVSIRYR